MVKLDSTTKLHNGTKLPLLGLGVWQIPDGEAVEQAVTWALEAGYRHIDTAKIYGNEGGVGRAIRASKIPREEIWITTKLWGTDQLSAERGLAGSLDRLGLDYVDLYLVHFPLPGLITRTWKQMEKLYESGQAKAIGVSNHSIGQLSQILKIAKAVPMVNQIKLSPYNYDPEMVKFCQEHDIVIEAYSPLTRGHKLEEPILVDLAEKYGKSSAQILIRWSLQSGFVVIPKSATKSRIIENANVFDFELSGDDMTILNKLN